MPTTLRVHGWLKPMAGTSHLCFSPSCPRKAACRLTHLVGAIVRRFWASDAIASSAAGLESRFEAVLALRSQRLGGPSLRRSDPLGEPSSPAEADCLSQTWSPLRNGGDRVWNVGYGSNVPVTPARRGLRSRPYSPWRGHHQSSGQGEGFGRQSGHRFRRLHRWPTSPARWKRTPYRDGCRPLAPPLRFGAGPGGEVNGRLRGREVAARKGEPSKTRFAGCPWGAGPRPAESRDSNPDAGQGDGVFRP